MSLAIGTYSTGLSWGMLGAGAIALALAYALNGAGVRPVGVYVVVEAGAWLAPLKSGVHSTVAGVALGLMTASAARVGADAFRRTVAEVLLQRFAAGSSRAPFHPDH